MSTRPSSGTRRSSVLGGPAAYSAEHGGHTAMLRHHLGCRLTPTQRTRPTRVGAIECTIGALAEARAVATRYEQLATHYIGFAKLGMIRLLVQRLDATLPQPSA